MALGLKEVNAELYEGCTASLFMPSHLLPVLPARLPQALFHPNNWEVILILSLERHQALSKDNFDGHTWKENLLIRDQRY